MTAIARRVAILRQPDRAEPLRGLLVEAGLDVVVRPVTCTEFVPPRPDDAWPAMAVNADWVVFTSLNAVEGFAAGVGGPDALELLLRGRKVAVLGTTSSCGLNAIGVTPNLVEEEGTATELVAALLAALRPGSTVLYPRAEKTMPTLPRAVVRGGHRLLQIVCYRTKVISFLDRGEICWDSVDAAFVAAPSAVVALGEEANLPSGLGFFAIGQTTASALEATGRPVLGVAETPRVESVAKMIVEWAERTR